MTSRSLPRTEKTPAPSPGRSLRTQSANKKLVSAPKQTFTRRKIPQKTSPAKKEMPKEEVPKKKRSFSFTKKKQSAPKEPPTNIQEDLPAIAKERDKEDIQETPSVQPTPAKPLKRQHISMVTSVRAVIIAAAVALTILVLVGVLSLRVGKNDSHRFFAVSKLTYALRAPERFDQVQVQLADGTKTLAHIVALPEEQIFEQADGIYIQLTNGTSFPLAAFVHGSTIELGQGSLDGKHTLLQNQMHYVLPIGSAKGQFVSREAIIGQVIWD